MNARQVHFPSVGPWVIAAMVLMTALPGRTAVAAERWVYLDNGRIRLGVDTGAGAGIGYLGRSGADGRNLVNHFDRGRLIQQSYYGELDGSRWGEQPWRWNPVQGGDYRGNPATVLELKVEGRDKLYARTMPKHWANGKDIPEVTMEEWVTLEGDVAHVRYRMSYSGKAEHPVADQEIPAVFLDAGLGKLVVYDGKKPWTGDALSRSVPGWPNESRQITEHWAAYEGADGTAVGAYVPVADRITCYRFRAAGKGAPPEASCSYFAPVTRFAIRPGFVFDYDLYLAIGPVERIRAQFAEIRRERERRAPTSKP